MLSSTGNPTKRAPDKWESARLTSLFSLRVILASSRVHARPLAGNASRWAEERMTIGSLAQPKASMRGFINKGLSR
jgi:hypothetical protein